MQIIDAAPAELTCTVYADRIFVSVAQLPSLGTLISATATKHIDDTVTYEFKTLLGSREGDEWLGLIARRVLESVYADTGLPLLLALALINDTEAAARDVILAILRYAPWRPISSTAGGVAAPLLPTDTPPV